MIYKKGDFIGQEYEVFDVLGEGGFGIVYLVYSHDAKAVRALKTFRDEYFEDAHIRERFRKEAQVWIDLESYPYLVRAHFITQNSDRLFIEIEYIASDEPGMNTLESYLRRRLPDLAQSFKWAIQFCYGMEHAYSKGIKAHRDIKPSNIMIDQKKTVKITDFGLAGVLLESSIAEQGKVAGISVNDVPIQTAIGTSIGTPEYMSPEQFVDLSTCDERSDIYSFGVVLYQMASGGRLPFCADNPDYRWQALKHFHQESPVPELHSPLLPVIRRCLQKERSKRYQAFKELRAELEPLLKQATGEAVKVPNMKELEPWELVNKGASLGMIGKHQEAIVCYDKAIKLDFRDAAVWNNKGYALDNLGKYQEAIACYDKAIEIDPVYRRAWTNRGTALSSLGKHQKAIACFDMAIEIDPIDDVAWRLKGDSVFDLGKSNEAIACYDRAIENDPKNIRAWTNKGTVLLNLGKTQEALFCFDKALKLNPREANAWNGKGVALVRHDRHKEALVHFTKAVVINPKYVVAWGNKALAEDEIGKMEAAIFSYKQFLMLAPKRNPALITRARKRIEELSK